MEAYAYFIFDIDFRLHSTKVYWFKLLPVMDKRACLLSFLQKQDLSHILSFVILWLKSDSSFLFHLHFFDFYWEVTSLHTYCLLMWWIIFIPFTFLWFLVRGTILAYLLLTCVSLCLYTWDISLWGILFFSLTYKNSLYNKEIFPLLVRSITNMFFLDLLYVF